MYWQKIFQSIRCKHWLPFDRFSLSTHGQKNLEEVFTDIQSCSIGSAKCTVVDIAQLGDRISGTFKFLSARITKSELPTTVRIALTSYCLYQQNIKWKVLLNQKTIGIFHTAGNGKNRRPGYGSKRS